MQSLRVSVIDTLDQDPDHPFTLFDGHVAINLPQPPDGRDHDLTRVSCWCRPGSVQASGHLLSITHRNRSETPS